MTSCRWLIPRRPLNRGPLSDGELAELQRRADAGWTTGRIAVLLNRHPSTIYYRQLSLGCYPTTPIRPHLKSGRDCTRFPPDEDAFIVACRIAGHGLSVIARAATARFGTKRGHNSVKLRLLRLAAAEADDA